MRNFLPTPTLNYFDKDMFYTNTLLSLDLYEDYVDTYKYFKEYYEENKNICYLTQYERAYTPGLRTLYSYKANPDYVNFTVNLMRDILKHIKKKTIIFPFIRIFFHVPEKDHEVFYYYLMGNWEDYLVLLRMVLVDRMSRYHFIEQIEYCIYVSLFRIYSSFKKRDFLFDNPIQLGSCLPDEILYPKTPEGEYEKLNEDKESEKIAQLCLHPVSLLRF